MELSFTIGQSCTTHVKWRRQISCYWHSLPSGSTANHCTRKVQFPNLPKVVKVVPASKKNSRYVTMFLRTCWHRNFILLALVCMCWNGSVARQKKQENEHNEPSIESTPRVSANATTPAPTTPQDKGLELEQPRKTSGNFSTNDTLH